MRRSTFTIDGTFFRSGSRSTPQGGNSQEFQNCEERPLQRVYNRR
ncbi:PilS cassette [Caenorhabditis elegans]|uniref:PilS cassette n=1 Tax=Caenorhabditis elegans TaxID=6239 RepID=A0A5E4LWC9_CAEEL|nr:PilS cassette [Caenorhabditis elegans]VVC12351.1 PilS cassette [Caenorhabditis elegans]